MAMILSDLVILILIVSALVYMRLIRCVIECFFFRLRCTNTTTAMVIIKCMRYNNIVQMMITPLADPAGMITTV